MASYFPPEKNLAIFDPSVFKHTTDALTIAEADTRYLRFPNAQGTENLSAINVYGNAHFTEDVQVDGALILSTVSVNELNVGTGGIDCSGNVVITDYTPTATRNKLLTLSQANNLNQLFFCLNPDPGAFNFLTQSGDNVIGSGNSASAGIPLTITTLSGTTSGMRLTPTTVTVGSGGGTSTPINRLTIDGTNMTFDAGSETAIQFNKSITMNSTTATSRQIFTGYLNLCDIASTPQSTGTQLYQNGVNSYWDNNVNGGNLTIAMNTGAGVQVTPMLINSTQTQLNLPLKLNAGSNITFPDNTVQTTAYIPSTPKVYTTIYVANQVNLFMPANVFKIDIRVVGRGGGAGFDTATWKGGSGAGGQIACITNCPLQDGYYININFVASVGITAGYVEVVDAYSLAPILRAYNGGIGGTAAPTAGGTAGIASPLSGTTAPIIDSNYGSVFALAGTNGSPGTTSLPSSIGVVKGSPPNVSSNYGNGQLSTAVGFNTWATGAVYITYYLK